MVLTANVLNSGQPSDGATDSASALLSGELLAVPATIGPTVGVFQAFASWWNANNMDTRVTGALRAVSGTAEVASGAILIGISGVAEVGSFGALTPVALGVAALGAFVGTHGVNTINAGVKQAASGTYQRTAFSRVYEELTGDREARRRPTPARPLPVSLRGPLQEAYAQVPPIVAAGSGVWSLSPTAHGVAIENDLAATEYRDWLPHRAKDGGTFPLVDFQKGQNLVSLKTVDTTGSGWLNTMRNHIDALATDGSTVNGNPANMILDLRVQPGGAVDTQQLVQDAGKLPATSQLL